MATAATLAVKIAADIRDFDKNMSKAEKTLVSAARKMESAGRDLSMRVSLPILAIGAAAVKMASDFGESSSKMEAVFGRNTAAMNSWIKGIRNSIPATTAQLQEMTSTIDAMLEGMGVATSTATNMSKRVTVLAADLASFNNVSVEDSLLAVRAALVGEFEPMRKYGAALSAATVQQEAYRLGLARTGQELTAGQKAQAALSLVLAATTKAHGDAERTAGSASNQFKFLAANSKELAANIGQVLLPSVTAIVTKLNSAARAASDMSPATKTAIVGVGGLAAAIGPAIWMLGTMTEKAISARRALVALDGVSALGGLKKIGIVAAMVTLPLVAIEHAFSKEREAAEAATIALDRYKDALVAVTDQRALLAQQKGIDNAIASLEARRKPFADQLAALPAAGTKDYDVRTTPAARADLNAKILPIDERIGALRGMRDATAAQIAGLAGGGPGGGGTGTVTQALDALDDRVKAIVTSLKQMHEGAQPIAGIWDAIAEASAQLDAVLKRTGNTLDANAVKARGLALDLRDAIRVDPGTPGAGLNRQGAIDQLIKVTTPQGGIHQLDPAKILGPNWDKPDIVPEKVDGVKDAINAGFKELPGALGNVFAMMIGAKIGGGGTGAQVGAGLAGAMAGGIGNFFTKNATGLMGLAIGGVVPVIGSALGGLFGGLFDRHKQKTNDAADAMERLARETQKVNEAITNLPTGIKIALARFEATGPEREAPPKPGSEPRTPDEGRGGAGGGGQGRGGGSDPAPSPKDGPARNIVVTIQQLHLPDVRDAVSFVRELGASFEGDLARGGTSPLSLAFAQARR